MNSQTRDQENLSVAEAYGILFTRAALPGPARRQRGGEPERPWRDTKTAPSRGTSP
jgi:hypothetical protein